MVWLLTVYVGGFLYLLWALLCRKKKAGDVENQVPPDRAPEGDPAPRRGLWALLNRKKAMAVPSKSKENTRV